MTGQTINAPQVVEIQNLGAYTPSPPRFYVEELLPADVVTLLAAHGGTGKTRLSVQLAICVAMGRPFMGKRTERAKVLFYSAEDDAEQLQRIIHEACKKLGVVPEDLAKWLTVIDASDADSILYVECFEGGVRRGRCTPAFEHLQSRIQSEKAQVVIVDNASDVYGCDENNRPLVRGFIRALRSLIAPVQGAVLLLSHVDKLTARSRSGESYSGSTAWHNSVRSRLSLSATGQGRNVSMTLRHQ